jgi:hypothetical protein
MSLELFPELLDYRLPRPLPVLELEFDQKLGELVPPPISQLANHVGADLARGREDAVQIATGGGLELGDEAARGGQSIRSG